MLQSLTRDGKMAMRSYWMTFHTRPRPSRGLHNQYLEVQWCQSNIRSVIFELLLLHKSKFDCRTSN